MAYQPLGNPCQAAMEWRGLAGDDAELRVILVGKSGGGKSATGNTILGRREFKSILTAKSTPLTCQRQQGSWHGRMVYVVDTPAMFDSDDDSETLRREIMACIDFSRPGPHAFLLVTQVGRFTAEDAAAAKRVRDIFGAESTRHTIVLFTCVEDLGGTPLQEYVTWSNKQHLRELIAVCGGCFCGLNNKAAGAEREQQVAELMAVVQRTVFENGGRYYINRLYLEPNLRDEIVRVFVAENRKAQKTAKTWKENAFVMAIFILCFVLLLYITFELF